MKTLEYSIYFANIILEDNTGRRMEIIAIDEDSARADITEAFAGVKDIQLGRIGAATR